METLPRVALHVASSSVSAASSARTTPGEEIDQFNFLDTDLELSELGAIGRTHTTAGDKDTTELEERTIPGLPPVDRGPRALQFLACAFILETVLWGYGFSAGILNLYLSTHAPFNSSSTASISAVGTVSLALQYMLPCLIIPIFQRYPDYAKSFLWSAVAVSVLSMFLSSFATSVGVLVLLQGVIAGIAGAVLYTPVLIWLQDWFIERRGTATGFIFAGTGLGGAAFPLLLAQLLEKVGFAWTMRIWSVITLVAFVPAVFYLHPRLPVIKKKKGERGAFLPVSLSFLRDPIVVSMTITTFIFSLGFFPVSIYLATYTSAITNSASTPAYVLAVYNLSSVGGQVGIGVLSDKISYSKLLTAIGFLCTMVCFFSFGYASTLAEVFTFSILFGAFSGICSVWSSVAKDVAGTNLQLPSLIFSCFGVARGIASVLGPILATLLYQKPSDTASVNYGSFGLFGFRRIIVFVGCMMILSAFGGIAIGLARRRRTEKRRNL